VHTHGPIHTRFTALHPSGVVTASALPRFVPFTTTTTPPDVPPDNGLTLLTTPAVYQYWITFDTTDVPITRKPTLTMP
jgi:hypothetical protein